MPNPRPPLLATRCPPEVKAAFDVLAAGRGQSASALLLEMVENVVGQSPATLGVDIGAATGASERMSVRLRRGDRELLTAKAAQRGVKTGSYLALLVRAHVRGNAPLPMTELNQLKAAVGELSAAGRSLNQITRNTHAGQTDDATLAKVLEDVRDQVTQLREQFANLVRANLESWEAGDA